MAEKDISLKNASTAAMFNLETCLGHAKKYPQTVIKLDKTSFAAAVLRNKRKMPSQEEKAI